jgi:hypothetical protein
MFLIGCTEVSIDRGGKPSEGSIEEARKGQIKKQAGMIRENTLIERLNARPQDVRLKTFSNKHTVSMI